MRNGILLGGEQVGAACFQPDAIRQSLCRVRTHALDSNPGSAVAGLRAPSESTQIPSS